MSERSCGDCTLCCKVLRVETLAKPEGRWCEHVSNKSPRGCTIYADRPEACRNFSCLWLQGLVPEELKPDRVHVVFGVTNDSKSLIAWADASYAGALESGPVRAWLTRIAQGGILVYMVRGTERALLAGDGAEIPDAMQKAIKHGIFYESKERR